MLGKKQSFDSWRFFPSRLQSCISVHRLYLVRMCMRSLAYLYSFITELNFSTFDLAFNIVIEIMLNAKCGRLELFVFKNHFVFVVRFTNVLVIISAIIKYLNTMNAIIESNTIAIPFCNRAFRNALEIFSSSDWHLN